eukprot:8231443-Heterocapsa_arctica.AAC.1
MEEQEYNEKYHDFGRAWYHQPKDWPDEYYFEGCAICPPQPNNQAKQFFAQEAGTYYAFMGLEFVYIGRKDSSGKPFGAKPHWRPSHRRK